MTEQAISREEFDALLKASPKWDVILEEICAAAYSTLRVGELDNDDKAMSLAAVVCIRPQDVSAVRIFHLNFIVRGENEQHG